MCARPTLKHILIFLPPLTHINRLGLDGLLRYIREKKAAQWKVHLEARPIKEIPFHKLAQRSVSGIIAHADTIETVESLLTIGTVPMMLLSPSLPQEIAEKIVTAYPFIAIIRTNFRAEGAFAARYLIGLKLRNFAFVGDVFNTRGINSERYEGFKRELMENGFQCSSYRTPLLESGGHSNPSEWLMSLEVGTGIFAANDIIAKNLIESISSINLDVPKDISVLGMGNDSLICSACIPQLSSVSANVSVLAYELAERLDELIEKGKGGLLLSSNRLEIVTRGSTGAYTNGDIFVNNALRWIESNANNNIGVSSVATAIGYSIKPLQKRFMNTLGHTIGTEIRRHKIQLALTLLRTTQKSINAIADICGFSNASHLCKRIKEKVGLTPNEYRKSKHHNEQPQIRF